MREGLAAKERQPSRIHHIRYEDLVATPDSCLAALFRHCQLDNDAAVHSDARDVLYTKEAASKPDLIHELIPYFDEASTLLGYDQ